MSFFFCSQTEGVLLSGNLQEEGHLDRRCYLCLGSRRGKKKKKKKNVCLASDMDSSRLCVVLKRERECVEEKTGLHVWCVLTWGGELSLYFCEHVWNMGWSTVSDLFWTNQQIVIRNEWKYWKNPCHKFTESLSAQPAVQKSLTVETFSLLLFKSKKIG